jgi:type IV secretory pathway component VirB8
LSNVFEHLSPKMIEKLTKHDKELLLSMQKDYHMVKQQHYVSLRYFFWLISFLTLIAFLEIIYSTNFYGRNVLFLFLSVSLMSYGAKLFLIEGVAIHNELSDFSKQAKEMIILETKTRNPKGVLGIFLLIVGLLVYSLIFLTPLIK